MRFKENSWLFICWLFILVKILVIDIDLPQWKTALYQPIDELYYALSAHNILESGSLFGQDPHRFFGVPALLNVFAYLFLKLFGDTYLGLRMSSIFFAFVSTTFTWFLLRKLEVNKILRNGLLLFMVVNFAFGLSSIVVEPTISRTASMLGILLFIVHFYNRIISKNGMLILSGLLITSVTFFTYPSNFFVVLAGYLSLVLLPSIMLFREDELDRVKQFWRWVKSSFSFVSGSVVGLVSYLLFCAFVADESILNSVDTVVNNSGGGDRVGLSISKIITNISQVRLANVFRFNSLFFIISVWIIIDSCIGLFQFYKQKTVSIICVAFLMSFLLQTAFLNDYPQRKLIILLPLLILLIGDKFEKYHSSSKLKISLSLLLKILVFSAILFGLRKLNDSEDVMQLIILLLFGGVFLVRKKVRKELFFGGVFLLLLIPESVSSYIFIKNRTYYYRDTFKALEKYNGANFIGGWSKAFTLYNGINSHLNQYYYYEARDTYLQKIDSLSKSNLNVDYTIGYLSDEEELENVGFVKEAILMKDYQTVSGKELFLFKEIEVTVDSNN